MTMSASRVRIVVCGSRGWSDYGRIYRRLAQLRDAIIIEGDAPGADRLAGHAARALGLPLELHPADWRRHGRRAGALRNAQMLTPTPALVIAFWDGISPGTRQMLGLATARGLPVEVHRPRTPVSAPPDATRALVATPRPTRVPVRKIVLD